MSGTRPWLVSAPWDLTAFALPASLALVLAVLAPVDAALGAVGTLVLVVLIDVAHVYASLWRTYLVPGEVRRRPWLYLGTPVGAFVAAGLLSWASWAGFWTVMAYLAAFHFIRQQIGFVALYRLVQGLGRDTGEARLERATVWALTAGPLVWWHANLPRNFAWFMPGDFIRGTPVWVGDAALALMVMVVACHLITRLRSGLWSPGRDLWLLLTGLSWVGGIVVLNGDIAFTATNVVLHGVAYLALVHETRRRRLGARGGPASWLLFVAPLIVLAVAEEALWDWACWQENAALYGAIDLSAAAWLLVPLLTVPQVTHYVLDAYIWRMGEGENPGLRAAWTRAGD